MRDTKKISACRSFDFAAQNRNDGQTLIIFSAGVGGLSLVQGGVALQFARQAQKLEGMGASAALRPEIDSLSLKAAGLGVCSGVLLVASAVTLYQGLRKIVDL